MAFIEDAIISGFISKIVNDGFDITKEKIRRAVQNKNKEHQTFESQIYNITVDVLKEFTRSEHKRKQDQIYDVAEEMLIVFQKRKYGDIEVIRDVLKPFCTCVDDSKCQDFIKLMCHEVSQERYFDLYREILLLLHKKETAYNHDEFQQIKNRLSTVIELLKARDITDDENTISEDYNRFQKDRKEEYINSWNARLFLHLDNNERPITLENAFIMPDYNIYECIKGIGFSSKDTLDKIVEKFIGYNKTSTMLITGVPGMGKSTLASWIANKYKEEDSIIILRFRDMKRRELEEGLLNSICNILECENEDLENKILVIDGFDEMKALDVRESVLNEFISELKDFENFKCIITSRPGYVNIYHFQNVINIKEFNMKMVEIFYKKITGNILNKKEKIETNLEVLGIPVILYMAIMSNVDISANPAKPELYSRIFAVKGGLFDKFFG